MRAVVLGTGTVLHAEAALSTSLPFRAPQGEGYSFIIILQARIL